MKELDEAIERVVKGRMIGADPEDEDCSWELGFHIEGAIHDLILDHLPRGKGRDLLEGVLRLVDWERVAEKATWDYDCLPSDKEIEA